MEVQGQVLCVLWGELGMRQGGHTKDVECLSEEFSSGTRLRSATEEFGFTEWKASSFPLN